MVKEITLKEALNKNTAFCTVQVLLSGHCNTWEHEAIKDCSYITFECCSNRHNAKRTLFSLTYLDSDKNVYTGSLWGYVKDNNRTRLEIENATLLCLQEKKNGLQ